MRWGVVGLMAAVVAAAAAAAPAAATGSAGAPTCAPGGPPVVHTGTVTDADARTYRTLPFDVAAGTSRIEVGYQWADHLPLPNPPGPDLVQTVFDLGLWDADGVGSPAGFRGWSGSRQGKVAEGQQPVWVQQDAAARGYLPDPIEPGTWHVDLGVASVATPGASYTVTVRCLAPAVGAPFQPTPVDPDHVARAEPGWYHADLHMHGPHSHPSAPDWEGFVGHARAAGLDVLPVTEYVTTQHHRELGAVQAAHPDLLLWPAREIITYFGHVTVFGETPSVVEWRHGAPGVTLRDIQAASVDDGALFGIAHPTIFPTPVFASFCRGCEFTLDEEVDWGRVHLFEVLTGPILVDDSDIGGRGLGVQIQNPFVTTALDEWQDNLRKGRRSTAVSGSDDKRGPDLGSSATAIHAEELSQRAIADALRRGRAYVRTLGVHASPAVEVAAVAPDGQRGTVGDTLTADSAEIEVRVRGGRGQLLLLSRDGLPAGAVPVTSDDWTHTFTAARAPGSGPLGTFWRVDTLAPATGTATAHLTTIGNPIFLAGPGQAGSAGEGAEGAEAGGRRGGATAAAGAQPPGAVRAGAEPASGVRADLEQFPATPAGATTPVALVAAALAAGLAAGALRRRSVRPPR